MLPDPHYMEVGYFAPISPTANSSFLHWIHLMIHFYDKRDDFVI